MLNFTPLEFETKDKAPLTRAFFELNFTPLEFETSRYNTFLQPRPLLNFTPLEFETRISRFGYIPLSVKFYSVGV